MNLYKTYNLSTTAALKYCFLNIPYKPNMLVDRYQYLVVKVRGNILSELYTDWASKNGIINWLEVRNYEVNQNLFVK